MDIFRFPQREYFACSGTCKSPFGATLIYMSQVEQNDELHPLWVMGGSGMGLVVRGHMTNF